jgi:hypothetical protein
MRVPGDTPSRTRGTEYDEVARPALQLPQLLQLQVRVIPLSERVT